MDKWTNRFKKRQTIRTEEKLILPSVQEALQNQTDDDCTIKYVAHTRNHENPEFAKNKTNITGFFSKHRLLLAWGVVTLICLISFIISLFLYFEEHLKIIRERDITDINSWTYVRSDDEEDRFNPYTILLVFSSLFLISSSTAWFSVSSRNVNVILIQKDGSVFFNAFGPFFIVNYKKVVKMTAYQILRKSRYAIYHFLVLELKTESSTYTLGQRMGEGKNYGLELRRGGFYKIQLMSYENETVFNMAKHIGLI
jgi:hypothetical protein